LQILYSLNFHDRFEVLRLFLALQFFGVEVGYFSVHIFFDVELLMLIVRVLWGYFVVEWGFPFGVGDFRVLVVVGYFYFIVIGFTYFIYIFGCVIIIGIIF
jgi:hypothetical protein